MLAEGGRRRGGGREREMLWEGSGVRGEAVEGRKKGREQAEGSEVGVDIERHVYIVVDSANVRHSQQYLNVSLH